MPKQTNSVTRLYDILISVIAYGDANVTSGSSASIAWTNVLEIEGSDSLSNHLSDLIADIRNCEKAVMRDNRIDEAIHLKHISRVKSGLLGVNSGTWDTFRRVFDDAFMDVLQQMSANMAHYIGEDVITSEDLEKLQSAIEDLINRITDSDLTTDLKCVLIDGLEAVRQSIIDYRIFGAEGIREALDRNVGLIHRYREEFKGAYESNDRQVVVDFLGFLKKVDIVVSTASKIKQLVAPAIDLMLGSGG